MTTLRAKFQSKSWQKDQFTISTDPSLFPISQLAGIFNSSEFYWASALSPEAFKEALHNSLSFGVYDSAQSSDRESSGKLIGIARLVTDFVTFAYLTDVWVDPTYQGKGLGSWLVRCMREVLDEMPDLRRAMLLTGDWERSVPFYEKLLGMSLVEPKRGEGLAVMESKGRGHPTYGKSGLGYD
ncbi:GNAT family N-acetyltransferase [Fusarium fujikuroi]|nr:GNAT family N-acetyltransferase [Fusarium fujikuroi]